VPGPAALDEAAATGAQQVRVFALRDQFPGHYAEFRAVVADARARGIGVVFVLMGEGGGSTTDPAAFGRWAGEFAGQMAQAGGAAAYEVWNEPDEPGFWRGPVDPARYVRILEGAYPRIKAADPGAKVLLGPLTGNNFRWLRSIYARGGRGAFDAVAVHTDTACLVNPPSTFVREGGEVSRFSFLGFRTVRKVMVANGDGAKTIWMTELGWSTATSPCRRGAFAHRSPRASPRPCRRRISRRPTAASRATPTWSPGCGSRSTTRPGTATSSTTTACAARTPHASRRGTHSTPSPRRGSHPGRAATSLVRRSRSAAR
jgi:hypothetical protein